jgi:hypothetical protein
LKRVWLAFAEEVTNRLFILAAIKMISHIWRGLAGCESWLRDYC